MTDSEVQIPVNVWLKTIDLSQYENLFVKYRTVAPLFRLTDGDIQRVGVMDSEHRSRIVTSLSLLASKLKHTVSSDDHSLSNNNDQVISASHGESRVELKKQLNLPGSGMHSYAWFHGIISRQQAEHLLKSDGDFLVRESQSQQGSYVLTCRHGGRPLHFVINRFEERNGKYSSVEYGFEGSRFASVQSLITTHISDGLEVTASSHARISKPVNRTAPLPSRVPPTQTRSTGESDESLNSEYSNLFIDGRDSVITSSPNSAQSLKNSSRHHHRSLQSSNSKSSSESLSKSSNGYPRGRDSALKLANPSFERVSSDPQLKNLLNKQMSAKENSNQRTPLNNRTGSDSQLNTSAAHLPARSGELKKIKSNAAHPAVQIRNHALYDEGADYSDYTEIKRMTGSKSSGSIASEPSRSYMKSSSSSNNLDTHDDRTPRASREALNEEATPTCRSAPVDIGGEDYDTPASNVREIHEFTNPSIPVRYLDIENFTSHLLAPANKPLDPECMYKTKQVLLQENHKLICQHITYLDLHLLKVAETRNLGAGVFSGIEAVTLPFGQHFRVAALERSRCLSYLSAVTILACTDDLVERSRMLKQWVLISLELLRVHGNLYSFMAIVQGLASKPIERLRMTWKIFNRMEPGLYSSWKSKIHEAYYALKDTGSYQTNEHVSIPYITPICQWYDRDMRDMTAWLTDDTDDINIMMSHLEMCRIISGSTSSYSKKVQSIVRFFTPRPDLKDLFKVELHMKLLYGHKGALANQHERWTKFSQILDILSQRAESNDEGTEC